MNKKSLEFSFAWLFAIIAGIFILFSAVYLVLKLVGSEQAAVNTLCAKEFSLLFNPMETGIAEGKASKVEINPETRIYNSCTETGNFGSQEIACSQKSGIKDKWPEKSGGIRINNKYVFSEKIEQGKEFSFFSKPFEIGFKVSEIIFVTAGKYCFIDAPEFVKDEISSLKIANVKVENCTGREIKVCFGSSGAGCNISVYGTCSGACDSEYDSGSIRKGNKEIYYTGSLIYAGIFSDRDNYLCNFRRLMLRIQHISNLYNDEQAFLASRGCGTAMSSSIIVLSQAAADARGDSSASIENLRDAGELVKNENSRQGGCRIW